MFTIIKITKKLMFAKVITTIVGECMEHFKELCSILKTTAKLLDYVVYENQIEMLDANETHYISVFSKFKEVTIYWEVDSDVIEIYVDEQQIDECDFEEAKKKVFKLL